MDVFIASYTVTSIIALNGNVYTLRGDNSAKLFYLPSEKVSTLKGHKVVGA